MESCLGIIILILILWWIKSILPSTRKKTKDHTTDSVGTRQVRIRPSSTRRVPRDETVAILDREIDYAQQPAAMPSNDLWIPQDKVVTVAGRKIGGMVYLGSRKDRAWETYGIGDSVIDPNLPVARTGSDAGGSGMSYYPRYANIDPKERAAYLDWLASGRSAKRYGAGYVFLYFYGLERRFFLDSPSKEEQYALITEVERLLRVYGGNSYSVRNYMSEFLSVASVVTISDRTIQPRLEVTSYEIPLDICFAIGQMLKDGQPLSSDWSLSWYTLYPETRFRTPAIRAASEFKELFRQIFEKKYPQGLKVPPPKRLLSPSYGAASGSFSVDLRDRLGEIPDIRRISAPLNKIKKIVDEATQALDSYSRFLGRNPNGKDTIAAHVLLPASLWPIFPNPAMERLRRWAEGKIESGGLVQVDRLLEKIDGDLPEKIYKRHRIKISDTLARIAIGMAPDSRFALWGPKLGNSVVLFRLLEEDIPDLGTVSEEYRRALLCITIGGFIAHADDSIAEKEKADLEAFVNSRPLTDPERNRLLANLRWIFYVPPDLRRLQGRLKEASEDVRHDIGKIALSIAASDGSIQPAEITAIERLYKAMDLPPDSMYSDLHALSVPGEPKTILLPSEKEQGYAIPTQKEESHLVTLDPKQITNLMRETEEVSNLLGGIFEEEEKDDFKEITKDPENTEDIFEGLDISHMNFLQQLLKQDRWEKSEYAKLAGEFQLMPEGALEIINDWSYERFEGILIDEDYELDSDILAELRQQTSDDLDENSFVDN